MNKEEQIIEAYFSPKWSGDVTAIEAFEKGREAAAKVFEDRAKKIRAVTFDAFHAEVCHPSVKPDSKRNV